MLGDKQVAALRANGVEFEEYDLPDLKTVDGVASSRPYSDVEARLPFDMARCRSAIVSTSAVS